MLIDRVELTLGLVDLGPLDEFALMTLFGTAHAHCLTRGTGHTLRDVVDASGTVLYGGYYWTHLRVPPARRLELHQVWDHVDVGVDVAMFGSLVLASTYALGRPGELDPDDPARWDLAGLPSMRASNTFYPDAVAGEFRSAAPRPGALAPLPKLKAPPAALARFRDLRDHGFTPALDGARRADGLTYPLIGGRDLRPDHGVMFARWVRIADAMERTYLAAQAPGLPRALIDRLSLVERETCYLANRRGEATLVGALVARWTTLPDHDPTSATVAVAELTCDVEIRDDAHVLVRARVRKQLVIPRADSSMVGDARAIIAAHAG